MTDIGQLARSSGKSYVRNTVSRQTAHSKTGQRMADRGIGRMSSFTRRMMSIMCRGRY